jgi:regulator of sirC expression with transglutaminase-like and TPR domain
VQATERFVALVAGPAREVPLDEAAMLIAVHADPEARVGAGLDRLDALARSCVDATFAGVHDVLFDREGFTGDRERYEDPANSMLHRVLERRRGIPITLSVVVVEVARRVGVDVAPIGMPGHFLVLDSTSGAYCDPFDDGRSLDVDGCRRRFHEVMGSARAFGPELLAPVSTRAVLARMLANLEAGPLGRDLAHLAWMLRLHRAIPGLAPSDRLALVPALQRVGAFHDAAAELDLLAEIAGEEQSDSLRRRAAALRARSN